MTSSRNFTKQKAVLSRIILSLVISFKKRGFSVPCLKIETKVGTFLYKIPNQLKYNCINNLALQNMYKSYKKLVDRFK